MPPRAFLAWWRLERGGRRKRNRGRRVGRGERGEYLCVLVSRRREGWGRGWRKISYTSDFSPGFVLAAASLVIPGLMFPCVWKEFGSASWYHRAWIPGLECSILYVLGARPPWSDVEAVFVFVLVNLSLI